MNERKSLTHIKSLTQIALVVAVMCVCAQISFYVGAVPITAQTLVIAFSGYFLGFKKASAAVIVYLMLGAVGAPVFASFGGGFHVLISYTGGFLWGFIPYTMLCAVCNKRKLGIAFGILGMLSCHALGVLQYSLVSKTDIFVSFVVVSLPFLAKDVIFTVMAYFIAKRARKIIKLS